MEMQCDETVAVLHSITMQHFDHDLFDIMNQVTLN